MKTNGKKKNTATKNLLHRISWGTDIQDVKIATTENVKAVWCYETGKNNRFKLYEVIKWVSVIAISLSYLFLRLVMTMASLFSSERLPCKSSTTETNNYFCRFVSHKSCTCIMLSELLSNVFVCQRVLKQKTVFF